MRADLPSTRSSHRLGLMATWINRPNSRDVLEAAGRWKQQCLLPPAPERIWISGWRRSFTKLENLIFNHHTSTRLACGRHKKSKAFLRVS